MKRATILRAGWVALGFCVALVQASAAVLDAGKVLPADTLKAVTARVAEFEQRTGVRLVIEFRAKSPSDQEDAVPGAFMRGLAQGHGTAKEGVLAVYFADEPDWRLWIGDALTARFAGKAGSVAELTENSAIHDAKEALFVTAAKRATEDSADVKSPQYLRAQTLALIDGLEARLQTK